MVIHNLTLKKLCAQRQFKESVTVCKKHPYYRSLWRRFYG
jgi:predicted transcriptional regulator